MREQLFISRLIRNFRVGLFGWMDGWMDGVYANEERMRSEKPNSKQQQQQILFHPAEVLCSLRRPHAHVFDFGREVGSCSEEEDWFVTHPGTQGRI